MTGVVNETIPVTGLAIGPVNVTDPAIGIESEMTWVTLVVFPVRAIAVGITPTKLLGHVIVTAPVTTLVIASFLDLFVIPVCAMGLATVFWCEAPVSATLKAP